MEFRACGVGFSGFFGVGALYVNIEEKFLSVCCTPNIEAFQRWLCLCIKLLVTLKML